MARRTHVNATEVISEGGATCNHVRLPRCVLLGDEGQHGGCCGGREALRDAQAAEAGEGGGAGGGLALEQRRGHGGERAHAARLAHQLAALAAGERLGVGGRGGVQQAAEQPSRGAGRPGSAAAVQIAAPPDCGAARRHASRGRR
jgi:hypothetical protein